MTSVKLQILQAIQTFFDNMTADQPSADPYGITWDSVQIGPLVKFDHRHHYSLGIVATDDSRESFQTMPYVERHLTVNMEIRMTVNRDDDPPGVAMEEAVTVVERGLTQDRTWGGLALDTKIMKTEVDLITYADRSALAVVVVDIQYRHGYADPRNRNPVF
jgi:hypothetical protein